MPTASEYNTYQGPGRSIALKQGLESLRAQKQARKFDAELQPYRMHDARINESTQDQKKAMIDDRLKSTALTRELMQVRNLEGQDRNRAIMELASKSENPQFWGRALHETREAQDSMFGGLLEYSERMGYIQPQQQAKPPSSVQEYEYARDNPGFAEYQLKSKAAGATSMTVNTGAANATPFEKKIDEKAADTVLAWTSGGRTQALQNVSEFNRIKEGLENGKINTRTVGDFMPLVSDNVRKLFNEPAAEAVNDIRAIAFQVLRETLGAQFTEKEGERLMATYFDPQLSEEANIKRMGRLANLTEQLLEDKDRLSNYMQKNRTAIGFKYIVDDPMKELRELVSNPEKEPEDDGISSLSDDELFQ